jgi:PBSX family phage portal protein
MARARFEEDSEDELDEFAGFRNEDGDPNVIDDVALDEPIESFYRKELSKMATGVDRFANVPYSALDRNTKRRVTRSVKKAMGGTKAWDVEQINGYELYELALPPYNLDHLVDLSVENDTHYACIVTKATNIVGLGYKWKEKSRIKEARQSVEDDDDKMQKLARKLQRVTDGLDEWLEGLNEDEDFNEILYKVWIDVEATGNGYLEVGRTLGGEIAYVGHIPAHTMRVRKWRDGFIQIVQDKLTFFRNFGDRKTPDYFGHDPNPNEVIHFKKHSPKNAYYGVPDIIAAMSSVAGEKFASEYNLDYFENKAVPRYALIVKGAKLSMQAERRILDYFRKEVKGKHHGTLYIPVPAHMGSNVDVKLEAIENKVQEASFEKYRNGNRESVAMVHRVPKSKLGVGVGVAAAREDDKTFKTQVCQPEQRRVEKKINRLVAEKTDMYSFKFEEYDLLDAETRSRIHDRYIRTGVENSNEIRSDLGYHPRKGGDKFLDIAGLNESQIELNEAQAGVHGVQAEVMPITAQAQADAARARATMTGGAKPKGKSGGSGKPGPARRTTDGSAKNKQQTSTPAAETPQGIGVRGTAADRGEVKSTRR